ncbi:TPA: helix-turn-helix domain-containing protein [Candidatus Woesearchaeota archaeon]|nr:helix-turn-helix domain-containing protein [Candidatus Woesearchaeota archaeon]
MFLAERGKDGFLSLPAVEIKPENAKSLSSGLAVRILQLLAEKPMYPIELANSLKVHEQKVYYHIRNLERAGVIRVVKQEGRQGAVAKYYGLEKPAVVVRFGQMQDAHKLFGVRTSPEFLEPFIKDGRLNALIIVGSPDPHGPEKARSKDGYYGMDLALFLGTFLSYVPKSNVKLDTDAREEDLKQNNLILIGGPVVNRVTWLANPKLPARFEREQHWAIQSTISGTSYPSDECGLVVKAKSPFNPDKSILVVAGKRYSGTRAAIIAFLRHFDELTKGNMHDRTVKARVVEGIDLDSDGIIDESEFRE